MASAPTPISSVLQSPARDPGGDLEARSAQTCDLLSLRSHRSPGGGCSILRQPGERGCARHSSGPSQRPSQWTPLQQTPLQRTLTARTLGSGARFPLVLEHGHSYLSNVSQTLENPGSFPQEPSLLKAPSVTAGRVSICGWDGTPAPHWFCAPYSLSLRLRRPRPIVRSPRKGRIPSLAWGESRKQGPREAGLGRELVPGKPFGRLPREAGGGFSGACNPSPTSRGNRRLFGVPWAGGRVFRAQPRRPQALRSPGRGSPRVDACQRPPEHHRDPEDSNPTRRESSQRGQSQRTAAPKD